MKPERQRIVIAQALGIKTFPKHVWDERDDRRYFVCENCGESVGWKDYSRDTGNTLEPCAGTELNYPEDLNAIHGVVMSLNEADEVTFYSNLESIIRRDIGPGDNCSLFNIVNATAIQRCEAYLKTIGKWEDSSGTSTERTP